jgi:outer membrane protein TolC
MASTFWGVCRWHAAIALLVVSAAHHEPTARAQSGTRHETTQTPIQETPQQPAQPHSAPVQDPMLAPVPPPAFVVKSWKQAYGLATQRTVNLGVALAELARTEADVRGALAAALPTLGLSSSFQKVLLRTVLNPLSGDSVYQEVPRGAHTFGGTLTLGVPLVAPQAWFGIGTAKVAKEVASLSVTDQKRLLVGAVANALLSVIAMERLAEINRVALHAAIDRYQLTRRRVELGSGNQLDISRLAQDVEAARAIVVTGDESLRQARENLGLALGVAQETGVGLSLSLDDVLQESQRLCHTLRSAKERPDVRRAYKTIYLQRRRQTDVTLSYLPTVQLTTNYSVFSLQFATPEVERRYYNQASTLAAVLNWAIFDGGVRYANQKAAKARTQEAEVRAFDVHRSAIIQVERTARGVNVAEKALTVAQQSAGHAAETDRLSRLNYELGRGSTLDLVDAARQLREAAIRLVVREVELVQSKILAFTALAQCE